MQADADSSRIGPRNVAELAGHRHVDHLLPVSASFVCGANEKTPFAKTDAPRAL